MPYRFSPCLCLKTPDITTAWECYDTSTVGIDLYTLAGNNLMDSGPDSVTAKQTEYMR